MQERRGGEEEYCNPQGKKEGEGGIVRDQGGPPEGGGDRFWFEKYLGKYFKGNVGKTIIKLGKGGMCINSPIAKVQSSPIFFSNYPIHRPKQIKRGLPTIICSKLNLYFSVPEML